MSMSPAAPRRLNLRRAVAGCAVILVTASFPLWAGSSYVVNIGTLALFFAIASTGLNVVYGYAGLLSFAQVGFWGLGAYASALLCVDAQLPVWLAIAAAGLVCTATAIVGAFLALRVSRDAFVVVTLSFSLLLQLLARNWTSVTRGSMGLPGLQPPVFHLPLIGTVDGNDPAHFYWITLVFAAVIIAAVYRLLHSRIGRAYIAINLDEHLARSQGIPVFLYQVGAFAVSATVGGLAGGLYVFHLSIVDPGIFDSYYTQMMLMMVIVGGAGHFWCVLLMAVVFTFLPEALRLAPELRMILFGSILVGVIQFFPQGLGGFLREQKIRRLRKEGL